MKRILTIITLSVCSIISGASENIVINGDFSKGSSRWKGDANIEFETPAEQNKICVIKVDHDRDRTFSQKIRTRKRGALTLKFKVKKSDNYDGGGYGAGYVIELVRNQDDYQISNPKKFPPPENNDWTEVEFIQGVGNEPVELKFKILKGNSGYLMFDDISATVEEHRTSGFSPLLRSE